MFGWIDGWMCSYNPANSKGMGYLARGSGWYRKYGHYFYANVGIFFENAFTPTCPWYRPPNQIPLEVALYYPIHANVRNSDDDVALRRHFALPAEWEGKSVWLYIEGILIYLWKISRTLPWGGYPLLSGLLPPTRQSFQSSAQTSRECSLQSNVR